MKKTKSYTRKAVMAGTFLASIILSGNVFASDVKLKLNASEAYKAWENNLTKQSNTALPRTYDIDVSESVLDYYKTNNLPKIIKQLLGNTSNSLEDVQEIVESSRFNLADKLNLRVENQGNTTECWAFSLLKSMETNIALSKNEKEIGDFSERHMDYATSRTFKDGTNEKGFQREVGNGGLLVTGLAYLTNGQGAVLEENMPFENNEVKINLEEINKPVDTMVDEYYILPTIHKKYTKDEVGNTLSVKYYKSSGEEYTSEELEAVRKIIKEQLVVNGAISSMTGGSMTQFYNNTSTFESTAYNCNDSSKVRDHAITIIGWDDNYSKENFCEGRKPSTDGAYIVLNSYGDSSFDNGYIYISYEDFFIEEEIYSIQSTSQINYDYLYQHDFYGGIYEVGVTDLETGYYAAIYDRESEKNELINNVGVTLTDYASLEIYLSVLNGDSNKIENLIKIATTETMTPGYHKISTIPTLISDERFAIVVKQTSEGGEFYFPIEANVPDTPYSVVESEGKSLISTDGETWENLADVEIEGIDMTKSDVCIKAFTTETEEGLEEPEEEPEEKPEEKPENKPENKPEEVKEMTSDWYIIKDNYILDIDFNSTKELILDHINVDLEKDIYDSEGNTISSESYVKTGMKLKLSDGREYILIIRGDTNLDGNITLTDLSKLIVHYNEFKGMELTGNALKAADMNFDDKVTLTDVSQMLVLYTSI